MDLLRSTGHCARSEAGPPLFAVHITEFCIILKVTIFTLGLYVDPPELAPLVFFKRYRCDGVMREFAGWEKIWKA